MRPIHGGAVIALAVCALVSALVVDNLPAPVADAALQPCAATPALGVGYACAISSNGEIDTFTISATAGQIYFLRASGTSGSLAPDIRMSGPTLLCSQSGGAMIEVVCVVQNTGTQTITVRGSQNNQTGSYTLFVQRTTNAGSAEAFSFGVAQADAIDAGEMHTYTLSANLNEPIIVRMYSAGLEIAPSVKIFGPDGQTVCDASVAAELLLEIECFPTQTGTHTVLVGDETGDASGTLVTYLQRYNNPGNATALTPGITVEGTLTLAELDAFTVTTTGPNEAIAVRLGDMSGFDLRAQVFASDGSTICLIYPNPVIGFGTCTLNAAGTYVILIADVTGDSTAGQYGLYVQNLAHPQNVATAADGEVWFQPGGFVGMYGGVINANDGDNILLRASQLSGESDSLFLLVSGPDGTFFCGGTEAGPTVHTSCPALSGSGAYLVLVASEVQIQTADYAMQLRITSSSESAIPTRHGSNRTGVIARPAEAELYAFPVQQDDSYEIRLYGLGGGIDPEFRVLRPDGGQWCSSELSGPEVAFAECYFDAAGEWRILVLDDGGNDTGPFLLQMTCTNCAAPGDADGDGIQDVDDNCPTIGNPAQANTDSAPLDIPGASYDDITRPADDNSGDACDTDDDNDGLLDAVEAASGCGVWNPGSAPTSPLLGDSDGDRSQDLYECMAGTNPTNASSKPSLAALGGADHDQLPDRLEPFFAAAADDIDSDEDGIQDGVEVRGYFSLPAVATSDADDCADDAEIASINGDTVVSAIDLNQVAQRFFMTDKPAFDLNKDGTVSALDLSLQAQNFVLDPC